MPAAFRTTLLAAGLLCLSAATAFADPGGRGVDDEVTPWNNEDYRAAVRQIGLKNFAAAVPLLQKVVAAEPGNADALNQLGFVHRQMGAFDAALGYYRRALAIDPEHLGANEYLGELWLQVGDLAKAEERLEVLDDACFFGCREYDKLRDAIRAHKQKAGG